MTGGAILERPRIAFAAPHAMPVIGFLHAAASRGLAAFYDDLKVEGYFPQSNDRSLPSLRSRRLYRAFSKGRKRESRGITRYHRAGRHTEGRTEVMN